MTEPVCRCGHALDEHEYVLAYRMCTVVGCACIHYDRDEDHNEPFEASTEEG